MPEAAVHETTVQKIIDSQPKPRADVTVVTPDNHEAYVTTQLAKDRPAVEPAPEPVADSPEAKAAEELKKVEAEKKAKETPPDEEIDHPDKGKKGKLQERFSDLTEKRKAAEAKAEREAAAARDALARAEAAERRAKELADKYEPPKSDTLGPKPEPAQFTDVAEFGKALEDWTADKTRRDDAQKKAETEANERRARIGKAWDEQQETTRKELPDYDKKLAESTAEVSDLARDAIVESPIGTKILYHLADHPEVADAWKKMTGMQVLKEIGKLEVSLGGDKKAAPEAPKPAPVEISRAPAPIAPLNGGGTPVLKLSGNQEVPKNWTYDDWKKARQAGHIQ